MSRIKKVVSNASPLIYLASVGKLPLLKDLFESVMIPNEVFEEVCGVQKSPDSIVVNDAVSEGWIHVEPSVIRGTKRLAEGSGTQLGEAAAILLAKSADALLLIDDKMGRSAAEVLGISCLGTVGVLLRALSDSLLTLSELTLVLERMIDVGFRLDSKVYIQVLKAAKELEDNR
ncbi:MAG: DUF3368 domain-containing protein [Candidatus Thorarchaeota archaeon]